MSDGPHRSLKMRPRWKKVSATADNQAATVEEVGGLAAWAFGEDWRVDVPDEVARSVCEILGGSQDSLFRDQKLMQLEALRRLTAGHGLGQVLIECAVKTVASGTSGEDPAVDAAANALAVWGARHARQVEEHYLREATAQRARDVRQRIESGISNVARHELARQLLKLDATAAPLRRAPPKRTDIDDGAKL